MTTYEPGFWKAGQKRHISLFVFECMRLQACACKLAWLKAKMKKWWRSVSCCVFMKEFFNCPSDKNGMHMKIAVRMFFNRKKKTTLLNEINDLHTLTLSLSHTKEWNKDRNVFSYSLSLTRSHSFVRSFIHYFIPLHTIRIRTQTYTHTCMRKSRGTNVWICRLIAKPLCYP